MSDITYLLTFSVGFVVLIVLLVFLIYVKLHKRTLAILSISEQNLMRFNDAFLKTIPRILTADSLKDGYERIINGLISAFDCDVIILEKRGDTLAIVSYSIADEEKIASLLRKTGASFEFDSIPLSEGRGRLFSSDYIEFEDPFELLSDITTSVVSSKIKREIGFAKIAASKVGTHGNHSLLILAKQADQVSKDRLTAFASLMGALQVLFNIKKEFDEYKSRFEDELESAKLSFRMKETLHQLVFEKMPIPAVLLDDKGFVNEANESFKHVFEKGSAVNSLFELFPEDLRDKFALWIKSIDSASTPFEFEFQGKSFQAYKIAMFNHGSPVADVVFFIDLTHEKTIQQELEAILHATSSELKSISNIAEQERAFSRSLVKNSTIPIIGFRDGIIDIVSGQASEILSIPENKQLSDFIQINGFRGVDFSNEFFETKDKEGKIYEVRCWDASNYRLAAFNDVTQKIQRSEELNVVTQNFQSLFEHTMPVAIVKEEKFEKWNEEFYELFEEILSSSNSVSSFYQFLGESPQSIQRDLEFGGSVQRVCRSIDGRTIDLKIVNGGNFIYVFARDLTDLEALKQNLRGSVSRMSALLESAFDEPIILMENGRVVNTNYAAREKLGIQQDTQIEVTTILEPMRYGNEENLYCISEKFYKLEVSKVQNILIYRLRSTTGEVKSQKLINAHRHRQMLLMDTAISESYPQLLAGLRDLTTNIFETYEEESLPKVIGVGFGELDKEIAEIHLYNFHTGKPDLPLSLTLIDDDKLFIRRNGMITRNEVPDTTFGNVLSIFEAGSIFRSSASENAIGFAFVSFTNSVQNEVVADLNEVLGVLASLALGIFMKTNASQQSSRVDRLFHVISRFSEMASFSSSELIKFSFEFFKSEYGFNGYAYYESEGSLYYLVADSGGFIKNLSADMLKFDTYFSSFEPSPLCDQASGNLFFAVQSSSKRTLFLFQVGEQVPPPFETTAVSRAILEFIELKILSEKESLNLLDLNRRNVELNEFINQLNVLGSDKDVLFTLRETLTKICGESTVEVIQKVVNNVNSTPLHVTKENVDGKVIYTVDLSAIKGYLLKVATRDEPDAFLIVSLAANRISTLAALELSDLKKDVENLRADADSARMEMERLKASVERVPAALKQARIEIDRAMTVLSTGQPDDDALRVSKLHLASALKEISFDMVESAYSLEELISEVREKLSGDETADRIKRLNLAKGADFKIDAVAFDIVKDIFLSMVRGLSKYNLDVLLETSVLPGEVSIRTGEPVERLRRKLQIVITIIQQENATGSISIEKDIVKEVPGPDEWSSIHSMATRLEKLGYDMSIMSKHNQFIISITESNKKVIEQHISKLGCALLIEDDRLLAEEESQFLLERFEQLRVAQDAIEAEKMLRGESFSFAFVDLSLPSISGREFCLQIKKYQPDCFTILLTNREDEEKSNGVDAILIRPIDKVRLQELLQRYVRG